MTSLDDQTDDQGGAPKLEHKNGGFLCPGVAVGNEIAWSKRMTKGEVEEFRRSGGGDDEVKEVQKWFDQRWHIFEGADAVMMKSRKFGSTSIEDGVDFEGAEAMMMVVNSILCKKQLDFLKLSNICWR